jgi:hypothetical protein
VPKWIAESLPGTVGLWRAVEGTGTTLQNEVQGGSAFTLSGTTAWTAYGSACTP